MLFGIIPECRSVSVWNERSSSPDSLVSAAEQIERRYPVYTGF
jgi:hypothetical protein